MKSHVGFMASTVLVLALVAQPAMAQLNSIPVYFNPKGGTGLMLAADYGKGLNDESGKNGAFAARASLGIGPFSFGGGVGAVQGGGVTGDDYEIQYMGNAALRVLGGGLMPVSVSLQAGVGFTSIDADGADFLTIPVGLGIAVNVPTPGFSVDPWVAARYTLHRSSIGALPSFDQNAVGLSGGIDLNFLMGLGLHLAADWESIGSKTVSPTFTALKTTPLVFGIGLHYVFTIPGLPGVPIVPGI